MVNAQGELAVKARQAFDSGDYGRALSYGLNYLVPLIGPQTAQAGEQLSHGDYAGGIGRTMGVALPMVTGKVAPELPKVGRALVEEAPRLMREETGEAKVLGTSPFTDWGHGRAANKGQLFGWHADSGLGGVGNTEGDGIYVSRMKDLASQFGEAKRINFSPPKKVLNVNEEPLHLLKETDELMQRNGE